MHRKEITRRQFVRGSAVLAVGLGLSPLVPEVFAKKKRTAVDQVPLGKTGLKLSRLGIGTGTRGGSVQRALGSEGFNKLIRYAYDQGITYIDTAQSYGTHTYVGEAIKSLPREKLFIQSKMGGVPENPLELLDQFRRDLGTDYIDSLLVHCVVNDNWPEQRKRVMDALQQAREKKIIRAHGVSCHSLPALTKSAQLDWVDVHLVRVNPQGAHMDTAVARWNASSDESHVPAVVEQIKIMRKNKHGVIGMKIIGEGNFKSPQDREKSIRFAMQCGLLDAIVIGFKSSEEIDEAITRMNTALAETA